MGGAVVVAITPTAQLLVCWSWLTISLFSTELNARSPVYLDCGCLTVDLQPWASGNSPLSCCFLRVQLSCEPKHLIMLPLCLLQNTVWRVWCLLSYSLYPLANMFSKVKNLRLAGSKEYRLLSEADDDESVFVNGDLTSQKKLPEFRKPAFNNILMLATLILGLATGFGLSHLTTKKSCHSQDITYCEFHRNL